MKEHGDERGEHANVVPRRPSGVVAGPDERVRATSDRVCCQRVILRNVYREREPEFADQQHHSADCPEGIVEGHTEALLEAQSQEPRAYDLGPL